jgi:glutamate 5-kinase
VAKIGSSSLTDARGIIDRKAIEKLCGEVAATRAAGHRVLVVTSGAVAAGVAALGLGDRRPVDIITLQALSAAGQSRLMQVYDEIFDQHGLVGAQVLLTPYDFIHRSQYLHARRTLERLLELGCIPVVNENDAIADDEIRFGDNDRIAALVAHLVNADVLVLLTDTEGLFTADPRTDPSARLIEQVDDVDALEVVVGGSGSNRGSGGMASKLAAARIASWSGVRTVIAKADRVNVLADAIARVPGVGTVFPPHERRVPSRKLWIAFAIGAAGRLVVDDGARLALIERGTSLLPAGVRKVEGDFSEGDAVEIAGLDGVVFARGLSKVDAAMASAVMGRRTNDLPPGVSHELVHRDDLVVLRS